jgi:hypothetical protein
MRSSFAFLFEEKHTKLVFSSLLFAAPASMVQENVAYYYPFLHSKATQRLQRLKTSIGGRTDS